MQIDLEALPDDPAILQGMLRSVVGEQGVLHAENEKLRLLPATVAAAGLPAGRMAKVYVPGASVW